MLRRRALRLATAFLTVVSLLFAQLALANYACPGESGTAAMAEAMAAGAPCEGMDTAQPVLCFQYASDAAQSFEAVKLPAPTLPALVQVLRLPLVLEAAEARALPVAATVEAQPPADPLFLSTLRLRV
jgi:hypothetical protein